MGLPGVEANGAQVTVRTTVENTGTMAGRQVVQVYLSKPAGKLDVPRQELCAFAKDPHTAREKQKLSPAPLPCRRWQLMMPKLPPIFSGR